MCKKQKIGKTFTIENLATLNHLDKKYTHFVDVSNVLASEVSKMKIIHKYCFFFIKVSYIYRENAARSFEKLVKLVYFLCRDNEPKI